jgi:hypothetical protein
MGEGGFLNGRSRMGLTAGVLLTAVLAGAVGGAVMRWVQASNATTSEPASTPVIILSVADLLRDGKDALEIRALADRLAEGGFLVLDAQAVLAAPSALYLQAGQEQETAQ